MVQQTIVVYLALQTWSPPCLSMIKMIAQIMMDVEGARVSPENEHFLLNPFGLTYSEVTASSLLKVDVKGDIVEPGSTHFGVNRAGFSVHSAIHQARPDIKCIVHLHTPAAVAVSAMKCGLLPMSQEALICGNVSYHEYSGIAVNPEEREKVARNLGVHNKILILRNHGIIACGETVEEAFHFTFNVMAAVEAQVNAIPAGLDNIVIPSEEAREQAHRVANQGGGGVESTGRKWKPGELEFEALMRTLDNSGYRTGYVYKMPVVKQEKKERSNSAVEIPPASSSFTYVFDGDFEHSKYSSPLKAAMERQKMAYKAGWLTTPNAYKKTEVEEIGTTTPKKITKWVPEGESPNRPSGTPIKIENPNQFAPQGQNPKEYKEKQKSIKKDYYEEKISAGPQSRILEGISWDEAQKAKDGQLSGTGDQLIVVGAASKGIIQRDHQHNAVVYRQYYAANPFENMSEAEIEQYQAEVQRRERGEPVEEQVPVPSSDAPIREPQPEPVKQETPQVGGPRTPGDVNGQLDTGKPQTPQGPRTPHEETLLAQLADKVVQKVIRDALSVIRQGKGQQTLTGAEPSHQHPSFQEHLMGSQILSDNRDANSNGQNRYRKRYFHENMSSFDNQTDSEDHSSGNENPNSHYQRASREQNDWFGKTKTGMWGRSWEDPAGAATEEVRWGEAGASNPEDDYITIQLNPVELFHGQSEGGIMKVRFSIQSTVRRRVRTELSRGGPIEEIYAAMTEPVIQHIHAESSSEGHAEISVEPNVGVDHMRVRKRVRRVRPSTIVQEPESSTHHVVAEESRQEVIHPPDDYDWWPDSSSGPSSLPDKRNTTPHIPTTSGTDDNISKLGTDVLGATQMASDLKSVASGDIETTPAFKESGKTEVVRIVQTETAAQDVSASDTAASHVDVNNMGGEKSNTQGKQTSGPVITQAAGGSNDQNFRAPGNWKMTSTPNQMRNTDVPAGGSQASTAGSTTSSFKPNIGSDQSKNDISDTLLLHHFPAEEDILFADEDVDDALEDSVKTAPPSPLKTEKKKAVDRKQMPPPPLPPIVRPKQSKSRKQKLRRKIKQACPPLSPVKEEYDGTVEEMEEMTAILEEVDDSFEQLLISAEDDLLISSKADQKGKDDKLDLDHFLGAAPMAMSESFDEFSFDELESKPEKVTQPLVDEHGREKDKSQAPVITITDTSKDKTLPQIICQSLQEPALMHKNDGTGYGGTSSDSLDESDEAEDSEDYCESADVESGDDKGTPQLSTDPHQTASLVDAQPNEKVKTEASVEPETQRDIQSMTVKHEDWSDTRPVDIIYFKTKTAPQSAPSKKESVINDITETKKPEVKLDTVILSKKKDSPGDVTALKKDSGSDSVVSKKTKPSSGGQKGQETHIDDVVLEEKAQPVLSKGVSVKSDMYELPSSTQKETSVDDDFPPPKFSPSTLKKLIEPLSTEAGPQITSKEDTHRPAPGAKKETNIDDEIPTYEFSPSTLKKLIKPLVTKAGPQITLKEDTHRPAPGAKKETSIDDEIPPYESSPSTLKETSEPHLTKAGPQITSKENAHRPAPGAKKETNIDDEIPFYDSGSSTKKETNIDDVIPSYAIKPSTKTKTETNIDDVIPSIRVESDIDEVTHKESATTGKDKMTLLEDRLLPVVDVESSKFNKLKPETAPHRKLLHLDEGPIQTSSPKMGRAKTKESPFKTYPQKLGKSEETLLEIMPLDGQKATIAAKSHEGLEDSSDEEFKKSFLSRTASLGPHHVKKRRRKHGVAALAIPTKSKETLIDDVLTPLSPGKESRSLPKILDEYHLMKHNEMMELSSARSVFKPPVIVAYPVSGEVMPPLPDTTEVPSISDTEGRQRLQERNSSQRTGRQPSGREDASAASAANTGNSSAKGKWVPKQKRDKKRGADRDEERTSRQIPASQPSQAAEKKAGRSAKAGDQHVRYEEVQPHRAPPNRSDERSVRNDGRRDVDRDKDTRKRDKHYGHTDSERHQDDRHRGSDMSEGSYRDHDRERDHGSRRYEDRVHGDRWRDHRDERSERDRRDDRRSHGHGRQDYNENDRDDWHHHGRADQEKRGRKRDDEEMQHGKAQNHDKKDTLHGVKTDGWDKLVEELEHKLEESGSSVGMHKKDKDQKPPERKVDEVEHKEDKIVAKKDEKLQKSILKESRQNPKEVKDDPKVNDFELERRSGDKDRYRRREDAARRRSDESGLLRGREDGEWRGNADEPRVRGRRDYQANDKRAGGSQDNIQHGDRDGKHGKTEEEKPVYNREERSQRRNERQKHEPDEDDKNQKKFSEKSDVKNAAKTVGKFDTPPHEAQPKEPDVLAVDKFLNSARMEIDVEQSPRLSRRRGGAIAKPDDHRRKKDKVRSMSEGRHTRERESRAPERKSDSFNVQSKNPVSKTKLADKQFAPITRSNTSLASNHSRRSASASPRIFENSPGDLPPRPQIDPLTGEPFVFTHPLMRESMESLNGSRRSLALSQELLSKASFQQTKAVSDVGVAQKSHPHFEKKTESKRGSDVGTGDKQEKDKKRETDFESDERREKKKERETDIDAHERHDKKKEKETDIDRETDFDAHKRRDKKNEKETDDAHERRDKKKERETDIDAHERHDKKKEKETDSDVDERREKEERETDIGKREEKKKKGETDFDADKRKDKSKRRETDIDAHERRDKKKEKETDIDAHERRDKKKEKETDIDAHERRDKKKEKETDFDAHERRDKKKEKETDIDAHERRDKKKEKETDFDAHERRDRKIERESDFDAHERRDKKKERETDFDSHERREKSKRRDSDFDAHERRDKKERETDFDAHERRDRKKERETDFDAHERRDKRERETDFDAEKIRRKDAPEMKAFNRLSENVIIQRSKKVEEPQRYAGFVKRTGRSGRGPRDVRSLDIDNEVRETKSEERRPDKGGQKKSGDEQGKKSDSDGEETYESLIPDNPIELSVDDNNNKEDEDEAAPTSPKKGILGGLLSCVGGKSTEAAKKREKTKGKRPTAYYGEGEKRKIKKLSKDKDKIEKGIHYFEKSDEDQENNADDKPNPEVNPEVEPGEPVPELAPESPGSPEFLPEFRRSRSGRRYEKKYEAFETAKPLSTFLDPMTVDDGRLDDDDPAETSWRLPPLAEESSLSSFRSSRHDDHQLSTFRSFGKANIPPSGRDRDQSRKADSAPASQPEAKPAPQTDSAPSPSGERKERADHRDSSDEDEHMPRKDWEPRNTADRSSRGGSRASRSSEARTKVKSRPVRAFSGEDDRTALPDIKTDDSTTHADESVKPKAKKTNLDAIDAAHPDLAAADVSEDTALPPPPDIAAADVSEDTALPPPPTDMDTSDDHPHVTLNSSAPPHFIVDQSRPSNQKHVFGPAHDQQDDVNDSHHLDTSYDPSASFDNADIHYRRNRRAVSFDERYNSLPVPQRRISQVSVGGESSTSRSRSNSTTSNPLIYEPWRAKNRKRQRSMSVSEMVYARGVARPRRSHSIGEIYNSTVASSIARRRSRTPSSGDILPRMYQPRLRSHSRASLGDTSFGSVAPARQRSFSGIDQSLSARSADPSASSAVKRSESERQPSKNPQMVEELQRKNVERSKSDRRAQLREGLGEDKPASPSKSDTMRSTDSASGGETLEERSSKEGSPTKEHPSPTKEKKKKKKFRIPSFSKKKSKESKESAI